MGAPKLVVIGAGPGGYPAAFHAADLGLDVTLVDLDANPGGVCLHRGCIPSKALLHAARVLHEAREAEAFGITFGKPKVALDKLREWKNGVVGRLTGGLGQMRSLRKVKSIQGRARLLGPNRVAVKKTDGGEETLDFDHAILATGSRPATVPLFDGAGERVMDSTSALDLPEVPRRLLVVGGGYIGLELGTVYASLGAKVTVVEMLPGLLPGADPDLVGVLAKRLAGLFDRILLKTRVAGLEEQAGGLKAVLEGPDGRSEAVFDRVLVSVGRRPNSEDLGLETTRAKVNDRGFIEVDGQRRTAEPTVFAIGDVAGEPMLAHKATHEGRVAVEVIAGRRRVFEPRAIPAVVFTDPEIAWCGLSEAEARAAGLTVKTARFPWSASGRATTLGRNDGLTKIVAEAGSERLIGVGVVGCGAGELIAEAVLALEMGASVNDLMLTIHPHPTLSETVMEAAEAYHGHGAHFFAKR